MAQDSCHRGRGTQTIYGRDREERKKSWKDLAPACAWTFGTAAEAGPCSVTTEPIHIARFHAVTMGRIEGDDVPVAKVNLARIEATERRRFYVTDKGLWRRASTDKGWRQGSGAGGDACADGCAKGRGGGRACCCGARPTCMGSWTGKRLTRRWVMGGSHVGEEAGDANVLVAVTE